MSTKTPSTKTPSTKTPPAPSQAGPLDYRRLMRKVEEVVAFVEASEESVTTTIHRVADEIICRLRDDLGLYRGRLYKRDGDDYVLRYTFPDARPADADVEIRVPRSYAPVDLCLLLGEVYMSADDQRVDPTLEARLGVQEFAAIEVGDGDYVLGFSVAPGYDREDILSSLAVVRRSINSTLRRQRMESIFHQAQQIQTSILPVKAPRFPPFSVSGRTSSMERMGGDLFDFNPLSNKILGVTIADASGHGLPAALQVRDVHVGLRMGVSRDFKTVRTVERLNQIIHASSISSRFVSLFYGELETNGNFIFVNAGHPPPFHLSCDGKVTYLTHGGPVLGPLDDATYERGFVQVERGEMVVLYTDGITEALKNGDTTRREEYGVKRLLKVARAERGKKARQVIRAIFANVRDWTGGTPPLDDRTVVVITHPSDA